MSITRQPYAVLSDNLLQLIDLTDLRDGSLVSTAAVTATVTDDATGLPVAGATWPLAMPAVSGSPGRYSCILPLELTILKAGLFTATIFANGGVGLRRTFLVHMVGEDNL